VDPSQPDKKYVKRRLKEHAARQFCVVTPLRFLDALLSAADEVQRMWVPSIAPKARSKKGKNLGEFRISEGVAEST